MTLTMIACGPQGGDSDGSTGSGATDSPGTSAATEPEPTTGGASNGCERLTGAGDVAWYMRCGGPSLDQVAGVALDAAGNIFVGLDMRNLDESVPVSFGAFEVVPGEVSDIVLVKFDPEGEALWVKHFSGPDNQTLTTMRGCADGVVLAGQAPPGSLDLGGGPFTDEFFLASLDGEGAHRWSRGVPVLVQDGHLVAIDMTCDAAGSMVVTGDYRGGIDLGGGPVMPADLYDGLVARYDPKGALLWSYTFGTTAASSGRGLSVRYTPEGEIAVVGSYSGSVDFGGGPLAADDDDAMALLLSGAGEHLWSRSLGAAGLQYGNAVAVDKAGRVAVGGVFLDSATFGDDTYVNTFPDSNPETDGTLYDGFLGLLGAQGDLEWSLQVGSKLDDDIFGLHFRAAGGLMMIGYTKDAFTVREHIGDKPGWSWSTPQIRYGDWAVDEQSVVIAAGVSGALDLGAGALAPRGNADLVLAKIVR